MKLHYLFLFLPLLACRRTDPPPVSFYYWKTTLSSEEVQSAAMARFSPKTEPLYLRLFDVDYSAGHNDAIPVGETNLEYVVLDRPVAPVVFITNRVFTQLRGGQIDSLAARVARRIYKRTYYLGERVWGHALDNATPEVQSVLREQRDSFVIDWRQRMIPEVQIDCDWTPATRDAYFRFLKVFKQDYLAQNRRLSCTIRLHQFRERQQNGVPPVDRGTLMCYNVASPKDTSARNAIFDPQLVEGYLKNQPDYPIPLDIALPVFNWGAWFRSGEFRGLLRNWEAPPPGDTSLYQALGGNIFQVRRDETIGNDFLREGDLIRLDQATPEQVLSVLPRLKPLLASDGRLLIFDWDSTKTTRYENLIPAAVAGF
jgi:hypothetical protein